MDARQSSVIEGQKTQQVKQTISGKYIEKNFTELCQDAQRGKTNALLKRANEAKALIIRTLKSKYAKELLPDYKPSFWNPHKERNKQKVNGARDLLKECEAPCRNLTDLKHFIDQYRNLEALNEKIDQGGGRLGEMLNVHHDLVDGIHGDFCGLNSEIRNMVDTRIGLMSQHIACEKEMDIAVEYMRFSGDLDENEDRKKFTHTEIIEMSASCDAYTGEYKHKKDLLVSYLMRMKGLDPNNINNNGEKARLLSILDNEIKVMTEVLDGITVEARREKSSSTPYEKGKEEIKKRIDYLHFPVMQQYQLERIKLDMVECRSIIDELKSSPLQVVGFLIRRELMRCFIDKLQFEEKRTFWDRILYLSYDERKNRTSFLIDSNNTTKLEWYKLCYSQFYRDRKMKKPTDLSKSSHVKKGHEDCVDDQKKLYGLYGVEAKAVVGCDDQSKKETANLKLEDDERNLIHRFEINDVSDPLNNSKLMRELRLYMDAVSLDELKEGILSTIKTHLKDHLKIPEYEAMTAYEMEHQDYKSLDKYVKNMANNKIDDRYKIALLHKWKENLNRFADEFIQEMQMLDNYLSKMDENKLEPGDVKGKYLVNFINIVSSYLLEANIVSEQDTLEERKRLTP